MKETIPHTEISNAQGFYLGQLRKTYRYSAYKGNESWGKFVELMGPDVVSLTHPLETEKITHDFINFNRKHGLSLTGKEECLLLTASLVHDWGELIIDGVGVGDKRSHLRTKDDEDIERKIFFRVLETIPAGLEKDLIREAYEEVAMDRKRLLGKMFSAIERIGYLKTSMRAFYGVGNERIGHWLGLTGVVLSQQIKPLMELATLYPYVKELLEESATVIDQMFDTVLKESLIPNDKDGKPFYDLERIRKAYELWSHRIPGILGRS